MKIMRSSRLPTRPIVLPSLLSSRLTKLLKLAMLSSLSLNLQASNAHAADTAHHGINWWGLGPEYASSPALGWLTLTFLIFVYGLVRAIKKPLELYLETRSKDIKKAIEEGVKAKLEGEKKLKLYEEKLAGLSQEIATLKADFMHQAEREKAEKARAAKESEARIMRDTDDTIKANFERTKNRLAEEVITEALKKAQDLIVKNQREAVDKHLKTSLISELKLNAQDLVS